MPRFGRMHGSIEMLGHLGNREPVDVAQREGGAMMRAQSVEHFAGARPLEPVGDVALLGGLGQQLQAALLA